MDMLLLSVGNMYQILFIIPTLLFYLAAANEANIDWKSVDHII